MTTDAPEISTDVLRATFERYADAFEAFDADAVAAYYVLPCLFVRGGETVVFTSPDALRVNVEALFDLHRTWDVRRATLASLDVLETAPRHIVARADWKLGRRGRIRWQYATTYVLVPEGDGWRIASALTHDAPF